MGGRTRTVEGGAHILVLMSTHTLHIYDDKIIRAALYKLYVYRFKYCGLERINRETFQDLFYFAYNFNDSRETFACLSIALISTATGTPTRKPGRLPRSHHVCIQVLATKHTRIK